MWKKTEPYIIIIYDGMNVVLFCLLILIGNSEVVNFSKYVLHSRITISSTKLKAGNTVSPCSR